MIARRARRERDLAGVDRLTAAGERDELGRREVKHVTGNLDRATLFAATCSLEHGASHHTDRQCGDTGVVIE